MIHLVLGTLFLVIVLAGYGIIYPRTQGRQGTKQLLRLSLYTSIWSVVLLAVVFWATESRIAAPTPLSTIFWLYAKFMSLILGAAGLLGIVLAWLIRRFGVTPDEE